MYKFIFAVIALFSMASARLYDEPIKAYRTYDMGGGISCGITESFYKSVQDSANVEMTATGILQYYKNTSGMLKWSNIILDMQVIPSHKLEQTININGKDTTFETLGLTYKLGMYVIDPIVGTSAMQYENQKQELLFAYGRYIGSFALFAGKTLMGDDTFFEGWLTGKVLTSEPKLCKKFIESDSDPVSNSITVARLTSISKTIIIQGIFGLCDMEWTPIYTIDAADVKVQELVKEKRTTLNAKLKGW